jgi:hypothetical protein
MKRLRPLSLRVASPCDASWETMTGDERMRHCGSCERTVYNLAGMSRVEIDALLAAREGSICARFYQRFDGTVLTADCPRGVRARAVAVASTVAALICAFLVALTGWALGSRKGTADERWPPATIAGRAVAAPAVPAQAAEVMGEIE